MGFEAGHGDPVGVGLADGLFVAGGGEGGDLPDADFAVATGHDDLGAVETDCHLHFEACVGLLRMLAFQFSAVVDHQGVVSLVHHAWKTHFSEFGRSTKTFQYT